MSKRRQNSSNTTGDSSTTRTTKRIRFDNFGAANDTDGLPPAHVAAKQQRSTSFTGACTRPARTTGPFPSLASLAINAFASNFRELFVHEDDKRPEHGRETREALLRLPDTLVPKVFAALRARYPTFLSGNVLIEYFLRGQSICLTNALPGATSKVVQALAQRPDGAMVTSLELSGLDKPSDLVFSNAVSAFPRLERLVLRGCDKAGPQTLQAVASTCLQLKVLNMNYTGATPQSIMSVLFACSQLEVLKIAGIQKLIAGSVASLVKAYISEHPEDENRSFATLRTLKTRLTALSDNDLAAFLPLCPNLVTLDISLTPVKHVPIDALPPTLRKLHLTSTSIPGPEIVRLLNGLPALEKLHLGALGESMPITSKGVGMGTGAGTITDTVLRDITTALAKCERLKLINLVGNLKIGATAARPRAVEEFISIVGRRCEVLNFENVPGLRSDDLQGLLPSSPNDLPSPIRQLNLARTNVDDDSAIYIAACHHLEVLNVSGDKIGQDALFTILDSCPDIHELDLTGCRSIKLLDRRRFFEVWESERQGSQV